jgi:hypothetical protein
MTSTTMTEAKIRRLADREGYKVTKSRTRSPHLNDHGEYMLSRVDMNLCVLGDRYDASLEDIAYFLNDSQKKAG